MKHVRIVLATLFLILFSVSTAGAVPRVGEKAPDFELTDLNGKVFKLKGIDHPFIAVCFFAPFSRASEVSISTLQDLKTRFGDDQVLVIGISKFPRSKVASFVSEKSIKVDILLDDGTVSRLYGAEFVLPTTYILGPDLKILDVIQGGGESGVKLLTTLAERELERKRVDVAAKLAEKASATAKNDPRPKAILAYAKLKEGKIDEAENDFKMLSKLPGDGQVLAKEGLAHVYWLKGDKKRAWEFASDVSGRSSVHVIKGDILYSEGKHEDALSEYSSATKKDGFAFQVATPYNKLGRAYAKNDKFARAGKLYEKALEVDPYSIEALSNKGVIFEKQGKWEKAHKVYKKAYKLNPRDEISLKLLQRAEEMLKLARDTKRAERIDRLVKELVKRYKENKVKQKITDEWTSRTMILAFLDVDEKGILTERAGVPEILVNYLSSELASTGRVKVVERALLDKLLAELNLGSSELADPNTSLRLGRVLAAKLLATGVLINQPRNAFLSLRMIDSETSAIPIVYSNTVSTAKLDRVIKRVSSELLKEIVKKYPLRGYVIQREGNQVLINLGESQGVKPGMRFALLEGGGFIEFKGKKLRRKLSKVGEIEITSVEPDVSYAKVVNVSGEIKSEMKIREIPGLGGRI